MTLEAPLDERLKAFAMCAICQTQYPVDGTECSKCHVALSVVRRCINCGQIVSAKHRKCIYCGLKFFASDHQQSKIQDPTERIEEYRRKKAVQKQQYWLKAISVSVATFLVVFFGVMYLTHRFQPNTERPVIATSYMLRDGKLHRTAGPESAIAGQILAGTLVEIVGFSGDGEQHWVAVKWAGKQAYISAQEIGPPKPGNPDGGFDVLKFYVANLNDPSLVPEAVKAVGYFNDAFPSERAKGDELRWVLAERARYIASRAKSPEELLNAARKQYEILIAKGSPYADKAKGAMNSPWPAVERNPHSKGKRESDISVQGEAGGTQRITGFSKSPTHEVVLLERANIPITLNDSSAVNPASTVACTVAEDVLSNGRVVIPSGAPCSVRIAKVSDRSANMMLTSITVNNHSYTVRTATTEISKNSLKSPLHFHLVSPVAINQ